MTPILELQMFQQFQDKILYHKMDSGVILSNFSLVIQVSMLQNVSFFVTDGLT